MPEIKDEDLMRLHLKARDLQEAALICGYTSPDHRSYADRMQRARDAARELLAMFGMEEKANV